MGKRSGARAVALLVMVILAGAPALPGNGFAAWGKEKAPKTGSKPVDVTLHDLEVVDQDGNKLQFAADVVGDRVVVIDTFYTTCGLICPVLSAIFMDLQGRLGERLGRDVVLISISVEPTTDIPPRLKEYANDWNAQPGWVFLTGEEKDIATVLDGLGLFAADYTAHPAAFLMGDGKTGRWTRFFGFPSPKKLLAKIDELEQTRP